MVALAKATTSWQDLIQVLEAQVQLIADQLVFDHNNASWMDLSDNFLCPGQCGECLDEEQCKQFANKMSQYMHAAEQQQVAAPRSREAPWGQDKLKKLRNGNYRNQRGNWQISQNMQPTVAEKAHYFFKDLSYLSIFVTQVKSQDRPVQPDTWGRDMESCILAYSLCVRQNWVPAPASFPFMSFCLFDMVLRNNTHTTEDITAEVENLPHRLIHASQPTITEPRGPWAAPLAFCLTSETSMWNGPLSPFAGIHSLAVSKQGGPILQSHIVSVTSWCDWIPQRQP